MQWSRGTLERSGEFELIRSAPPHLSDQGRYAGRPEPFPCSQGGTLESTIVISK